MRGIAAIWLLAAAAAAQRDWPRFRGPDGSGVSETTGLPVEFGPAKNVLWKTNVPFGRSSPVVARGRVFLTACEEGKLITMALDATSGRVLWRREIVPPRTTPIFKHNDAASPSPATDGANVYAFFPDLGLVSFSVEGKERWRLPLGPFDTFYGLASSPVLAGGLVLQICDARANPFLIAADASTGEIRWRVERKEIRFEGYATPVLWKPRQGPEQLIVLGANRVDAYEAATGKHTWWKSGLGAFPVGSPVTSSDTVLFTTFGGDTPMGPAFEEWLKKDADGDGRVSRDEAQYEEFGAIDANNDGYIDRAEWDRLRSASVGDYGLIALRLRGRGDLPPSSVAWRNNKTYDSIPTPLIYQDVFYLVRGGGIIASLDPATGEPFKIDRTKQAMETYYSSPVAADGKVYFTSESGKITVVKAARQWEILAVNDLAEECWATPALAAGRIFVRTRSALYGFGAVEKN
jgi:outer membrane protein assembly factor BamB